MGQVFGHVDFLETDEQHIAENVRCNNNENNDHQM